MMRATLAIVASISGWALADRYPVFYLVAALICVVAAAIMIRAWIAAPQIAALRAATLSTVLCAAVAVIIAVLLVFQPDLAEADRAVLRGLVLTLATAGSLYWLLLYWTGGFTRG